MSTLGVQSGDWGPQRGPRSEPLVGICAKPPEADIYTVLQTKTGLLLYFQISIKFGPPLLYAWANPHDQHLCISVILNYGLVTLAAKHRMEELLITCM